MSYNKKDLQALKNKLRKENPDALRLKKEVKIKKFQRTAADFEPQKKVVKWNYSVNDLVTYKFKPDVVGIIVADKQFFGKRIEKNYFYVLLGNAVIKIDGQHIRKL
jgi:hypothetical protein